MAAAQTTTPTEQNHSARPSFPEKILARLFTRLLHPAKPRKFLHNATKWFPKEQQKEISKIWQKIKHEKNVDAFNHLLKHLPEFKNAKKHALWKETVAAWLTKLQDSPVLREKTFSLANSCKNSEVPIAYTYQAMQKIALVQAMENKKYETSSPNLIPANTPIHAPMTLATSKEAQASALADLLREVRIKYKASFKSANKQRRSNPAGNTDVALAAFLTAPWQIDPSSHFLDKQTFKNSNVGNCSELAIYAKNLAINKGFSAHLHGFSTVDHAFTYIEDLRGPSHIGWVIDPWANIVARHTEYAQKLIDKMHKWESDTKHIYDQGVWKLPTDPGWLNGIAQLYKEGEVRVEKDAAYKRTYNTEFVAQLAPLRISRPPSTHSAAP